MQGDNLSHETFNGWRYGEEENEADICLSSQPGPWLCAVKQHTVRFPTLQRCQRLGKYLYIISNISEVDGYGTECRIIHFGDFWNMKFWYCLPTLLPQVEQDFTLMFGEDVSGKLLERWPTMLKKTDGHTKPCKFRHLIMVTISSEIQMKCLKLYFLMSFVTSSHLMFKCHMAL